MLAEKELEECCGAYCSDAGCCPFPKEEQQKTEELKEVDLFGKPALTLFDE